MQKKGTIGHTCMQVSGARGSRALEKFGRRVVVHEHTKTAWSLLYIFLVFLTYSEYVLHIHSVSYMLLAYLT